MITKIKMVLYGLPTAFWIRISEQAIIALLSVAITLWITHLRG